MTLIFRVFVLMLLATGYAQAGDKWLGGKDDAETYAPVLYAKGCYWHQGVRHCSSYCYIEINGKHYCNRRESAAVPQGDPYAVERPTVEEIYRQPRGYAYR